MSNELLDTDNENFYTVLECKPNATYTELKQRYHYLIKKYHPDKREQQNEEAVNKFIIIDKAFKTLKDEKLRKEYDASLLHKSFGEKCLIYAEICKSDLRHSDGDMNYVCRCGENILIPIEVLDEEEVVLECSECTNSILIK